MTFTSGGIYIPKFISLYKMELKGETKLRAMEEALFLPKKTLLMREVNKRSTSGINY